ncbi:MAG: DUF523 and DUF1722 domain-containing protein [Sulfurovum sp.]
MINIGTSSCLLGNTVRYDGANNKDKFIVNKLMNYFNFVPFCPEHQIWGTPRDTIRLVSDENENIKVVTSRAKVDMTEPLENVCDDISDEIETYGLSGFILKSGSPTCGLARVKVYKEVKAPSENKGVGIFAKKLQEKYPYLPIEEEGRLNDAWLRENFLMQVYAYADLHEMIATNPSYKDLVQFHTKYKYLIMAKSELSYKILGNLVANHDNKSIEDILIQYRQEFLIAINKKGSVAKTYNVLQHIFGYFKKLISNEEKEVILETLNEYKEKIIPLIAVVKIINIYVKRFDVEYLKTQKFLNPYPSEFALRSDIKAYK